MLCLPPPTSTSKLQLNYRTITLQNHLKPKRTEVLSLRIQRRSQGWDVLTIPKLQIIFHDKIKNALILNKDIKIKTSAI